MRKTKNAIVSIKEIICNRVCAVLPKSFESAKDISQFLLDRTGYGLLTENFDLFAGCFGLPTEIHTYDGRQVLTTKAQLREVYDRVRTFYLCHNVTHLIRECTEAQFCDDTSLKAVHETRLLSGTRSVKDPYAALSFLRRIDGYWKIVRSDYAVSDPITLVAALTSDLKTTA